jgi:hypothetical protein
MQSSSRTDLRIPPVVLATEYRVRRYVWCRNPILNPAWHTPIADMVDTTERPRITGIVSFAFTLCCLDYPFSKTATNLIIAEPFDAVLAHAFVTHQRIKLIFQ